jgi:hypothetical protein
MAPFRRFPARAVKAASNSNARLRAAQLADPTAVDAALLAAAVADHWRAEARLGLSDRHFAAPLNHFTSGFPSKSVAVFRR